METLPATVDLASWQHDGYLVLPRLLESTQVTAISRWAEEVHNLPGSTSGILQYNETTTTGETVRCRTENFVPFHNGLQSLCQRGPIQAIASALFGETATLYKEKLNYKHPGGAGFAAHQDAPAYPNVTDTIACLIAVDAATTTNGCLEVATGQHTRLLPTDDGGCINPRVAETLTFEPLEVPAGTVVFFHCHLPHRSAPNHSNQSRRAIYLTFNRASEGELRDEYYAHKIAQLAHNPHNISLINHFTGTARPSTAPAVIGADIFSTTPTPHNIDACIHALTDYLIKNGQSRYDEAVTQLDHGLQSAALAAREGHDEALQIACLLHDIGHLMIGEHSGRDDFLDHDEHHENVATNWLTTWFGPHISEPVALHVAAKRYLVAADPVYATGLSNASTRSLAVQGGPMTGAEQKTFESNPHHQRALTLRKIDDRAKQPGRRCPGLDSWAPVLRRVMLAHMHNTTT